MFEGVTMAQYPGGYSYSGLLSKQKMFVIAGPGQTGNELILKKVNGFSVKYVRTIIYQNLKLATKLSCSFERTIDKYNFVVTKHQQIIYIFTNFLVADSNSSKSYSQPTALQL